MQRLVTIHNGDLISGASIRYDPHIVTTTVHAVLCNCACSDIPSSIGLQVWPS